MSTVIPTRFRVRRDTAANWASVNPVLLEGEPGLETDTRKLKHGDGATAWNALAYLPASVGAGTISTTELGGDITAAGKALLDDADAAAQRTTLGLGTAAVKNTGTSGDAVPVLNSATITFGGTVGIGLAPLGGEKLHLRDGGVRISSAANGTLGFLEIASAIMTGASAASMGFRAEAGLELSGGGNQRHLAIDSSGNIKMGGTNTVISAARHHQFRSYTVGTLPSAATATQMIYVSNEAGGAVPAFSDGTNWRRVTDRAIVS